MSKRPKHYWNHRVLTNFYSETNERTFSVREVYYYKGKPDSYAGAKGMLFDQESLKSLKRTHKQIKRAFKLPILDADNWPKKWKI